MKPSRIIPADAQDQFWSVMRRCLVEFHRQSPAQARSNVARLRAKVHDLPDDEMEWFYHSEPFDVACRAADEPLNLDRYLPRYLELRDKEDHNGSTNGKQRKPRK